MHRRICFLLLVAALCLLCGCEFRTIDQMYCLPERPESYNNLQSEINKAMVDREYCAPIAGENQQTVQMADLNGDGIREYLLFTRSNGDMPLQILIFTQVAESYALADTIACHGTAFETVEYVQLDQSGGMELVVGRRIGGEVLRSVSVYKFSADGIEQLMTTNYAKMLTCDLDGNGRQEIMVLRPGQTDADNGVAELYTVENGAIVRSNEAFLSGSTDRIKRIISGKLHNGIPAVFVASVVDENAIITDVYATVEGVFTNVSISNEVGTSVQTLRNYYVYADDIDEDGEVELPDLISMQTVSRGNEEDRQYIIRWYAMGIDGTETNKMFTYHNFVGGWYLKLDDDWASRISVEQSGAAYEFYLWDTAFTQAQRIFTVHAFTGNDREGQAVSQNRFVLFRTESTTYAAHLEVASGAISLTQDDLINGFHLIRQEWKTGET